MARAKRVQRKSGARLPEPDPEIMSSDSEELVLHNDDAQDESDMESLEEAVFDLDGGSEDESDEDDEHEASERYKALAKQARALEAKMRVARGEDEESSSEEEAEQKAVERWGKKGAYYAADNVDLEGSEEEDALQDEEEEALRLQKSAVADLSAEDYGALPGDEEEKSLTSEEEEEEEHVASDEERVEFVPRDIEGLTEEERKAAVARAAPELAGLLAELQASLAEVRHRVGPLLEEVKQGGLATAEGVSYLEAKHLLLLQYCANIVFYFLLKAEGRRVAGHPVVARLVEIKSYLEKIRPIDKRLKHQVDKLLQAATNATAAPALAAAPRPDALLAEDAARAEEDRRMLAELGEDGGVQMAQGAERADGVYRPPRIAPTSMELEKEGKAEARAAREALHRATRAKRSGLMSELAAEMEGRPEELRETLAGMDTAEAVRMRNRANARAAVEEELFVRIPLGRDELKAQRAAQRAGLAGAALLDDFHQDMAGILDDAPDVGAYGRHRTAQRWGGEANNLGAESRGGRSGDADLAVREPLTERRAKYDSLVARRGLDADNQGSRKKSKLAREEDEFYREVKAAKKEAKEKRTVSYHREDPQPPREEPQAPGARAINRAIEKNRGLTPNKGKAHANPRTARRHKFDRATSRRRSVVQEVTPGAAGMYGGEKTGIKARLTKSTKFG